MKIPKEKYGLLASIICFVLSLILPVYLRFPLNTTTSGYGLEGFGYEFLTLGWIMLLEYVPDFIVWFSNITLVLSWLFYKKKISNYFAYFSAGMMSLYFLDYLLNLEIFEIVYHQYWPCGLLFWVASGVLMAIFSFKKTKALNK